MWAMERLRWGLLPSATLHRVGAHPRMGLGGSLIRPTNGTAQATACAGGCTRKLNGTRIRTRSWRKVPESASYHLMVPGARTRTRSGRKVPESASYLLMVPGARTRTRSGRKVPESASYHLMVPGARTWTRSCKGRARLPRPGDSYSFGPASVGPS